MLSKMIVKSPNDKRLYKYLRFPNKLQAILISDPEADLASACLDVGVGSALEPKSRPGLAHFWEHMLFMGTEKYPKENDYSVYLKDNAGHSNAYTALTSTNYFFAVSNPAFEGALDRFSWFFKVPLFNEDSTTREMNAVDSEHKKNLQSDTVFFNCSNFSLDKTIFNLYILLFKSVLKSVLILTYRYLF